MLSFFGLPRKTALFPNPAEECYNLLALQALWGFLRVLSAAPTSIACEAGGGAVEEAEPGARPVNLACCLSQRPNRRESAGRGSQKCFLWAGGEGGGAILVRA